VGGHCTSGPGNGAEFQDWDDKAAETAHTAYQIKMAQPAGSVWEKFDAKRSAKLPKTSMSHHQYLGIRLVNQVI
jgi:hypothetical protein